MHTEYTRKITRARNYTTVLLYRPAYRVRDPNRTFSTHEMIASWAYYEQGSRTRRELFDRVGDLEPVLGFRFRGASRNEKMRELIRP